MVRKKRWLPHKQNGAGEGNRTPVRSMGSSYSAIELRPHGGEGGIRTPDTREGMHDFESCAFNQALPPLRRKQGHKISHITFRVKKQNPLSFVGKKKRRGFTASF